MSKIHPVRNLTDTFSSEKDSFRKGVTNRFRMSSDEISDGVSFQNIHPVTTETTGTKPWCRIHTPVMMSEVLNALSPKPGDFIIDGTLGGGGHALEIAKRISPNGTLLGVDRDPAVAKKVEINIPGIKVILVCANYANLTDILKDKRLPLADGLLLDLGFSSNQLEEGRGFSFMKDEPLLMTYSNDDEPLYQALRRLSKDDLTKIISVSGERYARVIAEAIWQAKRKNLISTTGELVKIIRSVLPLRYERGRIHPATRTFLGLRIYINKELESLEKVLDDIPKILKPGGRAAIITFQSLEDKIVKNKFKEMSKTGKISILTKKPSSPAYPEIKANPKARSAKLRAATINPSPPSRGILDSTGMR